MCILSAPYHIDTLVTMPYFSNVDWKWLKLPRAPVLDGKEATIAPSSFLNVRNTVSLRELSLRIPAYSQAVVP